MARNSLLFRNILVKISGVKRKHASAKFEDDNDELVEVTRRIAHDIDSPTRGVFWQFNSGGRELLVANPGIYSGLLLSHEFSVKTESDKVIVKDIPRTFASQELFRRKDGPGHRSLYNVLKAYSVYDTEVGYTQGMNFIAAMLLLYMNEEEVFWVMVALLKGKQMRGVYLEGLPLLHQYFFQLEMLLREHLPQLANHFEEQMITPAMYASSWLMTAFSADLPLSLVVPIWDVFLCDGMRAIIGVALALLKFFQTDLLKLHFENLLLFLRGFPKDDLDANTLISMACSLPLKKRLEELELDYLVSNDNSSASRESNDGGWNIVINPNDKELSNDGGWNIVINPNDKEFGNNKASILSRNCSDSDGWIVIDSQDHKKRILENQRL